MGMNRPKIFICSVDKDTAEKLEEVFKERGIETEVESREEGSASVYVTPFQEATNIDMFYAVINALIIEGFMAEIPTRPEISG